MLSFVALRPPWLPFPRRSHIHRSFVPICSKSNVTPTPPIPLSHALNTAPQEPGVYRFLDLANAPIYIGKARQLRTRLRNYLTPSGTLDQVHPRIAAMLADANALDFVLTSSESAALALEASLIAEYRPKYNVLLKDDRRHPYAVITFSEQYPRIIISRTRRVRPGDRIYGPFVEEHKLRRLLSVIHTVFPLRQRKRPLFTDRPCINYDLGRCPGVCQQLITPAKYSETIAEIDKLLSGRVEEVLADMHGLMQRHSDAMQYEQAALVRDRISSLQGALYVDPLTDGHLMHDHMTATSIVGKDAFDSRDIFAISSDANHAKAVLFQVRGGKVVSRLVFSVEVQGQSKGELLSAVISSHYGAASHAMEIPEEVVVCVSVPDEKGLRRVLSEKRGKQVTIRGKRGTKGLAAIAQKNANMELDVEKRLAERVTNDLQVLADTLRPHLYHNSDRARVREEQSVASNRLDIIQQQNNLTLSRIECFDISHTSGSNAVGSMAVFLDGRPAFNEYRRYKLETEFSSQGHPDDFESIRETLRRRLRHFDKNLDTNPEEQQHFPNLIVIDGGKGQLSAAVGILRTLGLTDVIPVISIAKGEEAIFVDGFPNPINYDSETDSCKLNDGLRLLCQIRDEAHRTAINAHRKRRGSQALRSGLDSVPGLGAKKRAALLDHFNGSSEAVAAAEPAQLMQSPGIGPALAQRIFSHYHSSKIIGLMWKHRGPLTCRLFYGPEKGDVRYLRIRRRPSCEGRSNISVTASPRFDFVFGSRAMAFNAHRARNLDTSFLTMRPYCNDTSTKHLSWRVLEVLSTIKSNIARYTLHLLASFRSF